MNTKQILQHLDILISSQEDLVSKSALTPIGEGYLEGLKSARKLFNKTTTNKLAPDGRIKQHKQQSHKED